DPRRIWLQHRQLLRVDAGARYQDRWSPIALPKARAALPRRVPRPVGLRGRAQPPLQLQTEILRSLQPADQILTDVSHGGGARSEGKHSIEAGNTVGIRRSHIQASGE